MVQAGCQQLLGLLWSACFCVAAQFGGVARWAQVNDVCVGQCDAKAIGLVNGLGMAARELDKRLEYSRVFGQMLDDYFASRRAA